MIYFDLETYSEADLEEVGLFTYAAHPSTTVLCAAWCVRHVGEEEHPLLSWRPGEPVPVALFDAVSAGARVKAHNVAFDAEVWRCVLTPRFGWWWPGYEAFGCTMAQAQITNLPGALAQVAAFFGGAEKDRAGHLLMKRLCRPARAIIKSDDPKRLHTEENLGRLVEYCKQDVRAEMGVAMLLPELSPTEDAVWRSTWAMNRRGVQVDVPLVAAAVEMAERVQAKYRDRLSQVTGGEVETETQRARLATFIEAHGGRLPLTEKGSPSFARHTEHLIDLSKADERAVAAMALYRTLNKSSIAKYRAMLRCVNSDERLRGMFCYSGAGQTGRDAGRLVQLQNLPRGILEGEEAYRLGREILRSDADLDCVETLYGDAMAFLSSMIRACLVAAPGCRLIAADYSAIEGRVLAWLAGEQHIVQAYREGKRLYAVVAAGIFGCTYEQVMAERAAGHKKKDQVGKVGDLACGYQGGSGAMERMGGRKLGMTPEQMQETVDAWRRTHPATVALWAGMQRAALHAMRHPHQPVWAVEGKVRFGFNGDHLKMELPSKRCLWYRRARLGEKVWPDGGTSPQIEYYGLDEHNRAGWITTYGGKLTENAVQAIARDLLMDAAVRAEAAGWAVVLRVHDELVAEEPVSGRGHQELCELMCRLPAWAEDLPIAAAGWSGDFYRKD